MKYAELFWASPLYIGNGILGAQLGIFGGKDLIHKKGTLRSFQRRHSLQWYFPDLEKEEVVQEFPWISYF